MIERPILFSGPMVRAILAGHKTQTRRVVRGDFDTIQPSVMTTDGKMLESHWTATGPAGRVGLVSPYGVDGHKLWVRETWDFRPWATEDAPTAVRVAYAADGEQRDVVAPADWNPTLFGTARWRPSIHMPRWASRLTLEVTDVRVERLQCMSEEDAIAEGVVAPARWASVPGFAVLWDSLNAARGFGWDANPWVWVIEFRRVS
ncbi:MAG: hypothetical protein C0503_00770 [Gemmatimonas sp.]|nr:hypothetical protein [Gemmatimonas sp.]